MALVQTAVFAPVQETVRMAQVHILTGPERRRRFSLEQKQAIVAAPFAPGAVVSIHHSHASPSRLVAGEMAMRCMLDKVANRDWTELLHDPSHSAKWHLEQGPSLPSVRAARRRVQRSSATIASDSSSARQ